MKKTITSVIGVVALAAVMFGQTVAYAQDLRLTISRVEAPLPQSVVVTWPGETGAVYQAWYSTNLMDWRGYVVLATNIFRSSIAAEGAGFFRVQKLPRSLVAQNDMLFSDILIAGSTGNFVARYKFFAADQGFTINRLKLKAPATFANSLASVMIQYKDKSGDLWQTWSFFMVNYESNAVATFVNLPGIYVPANEWASVNVYVNVNGIYSGASSGACGAITLLANEGFSSTGDSGKVVTSAGPADLTGNTFYVRKSKPTFAIRPLDWPPSVGVNSLFKFTVTADGGQVDLKQLGLRVLTQGCNVNGLYLTDSNGTRLTNPVDPDPTNGVVKLLIGAANDEQVLTIGGATSQTYTVRGIVNDYHYGDIVAVRFMQDDSPVPDGTAADLITGGAYNVWSDWSTGPVHSVFSADWSNGYLLKEMD